MPKWKNDQASNILNRWMKILSGSKKRKRKFSADDLVRDVPSVSDKCENSRGPTAHITAISYHAIDLTNDTDKSQNYTDSTDKSEGSSVVIVKEYKNGNNSSEKQARRDQEEPRNRPSQKGRKLTYQVARRRFSPYGQKTDDDSSSDSSEDSSVEIVEESKHGNYSSLKCQARDNEARQRNSPSQNRRKLTYRVARRWVSPYDQKSNDYYFSDSSEDDCSVVAVRKSQNGNESSLKGQARSNEAEQQNSPSQNCKKLTYQVAGLYVSPYGQKTDDDSSDSSEDSFAVIVEESKHGNDSLKSTTRSLFSGSLSRSFTPGKRARLLSSIRARATRPTYGYVVNDNCHTKRRKKSPDFDTQIYRFVHPEQNSPGLTSNAYPLAAPPESSLLSGPVPKIILPRSRLGSQKLTRPLSRSTALARRPTCGLIVSDKNQSKVKEKLPERTTQNAEFAGTRRESKVFTSKANSSPRFAFTLEEFVSMWTNAEINFGKTTEEIEKDRLVTEGNRRVDPKDSNDQERAQYGRLLPGATDKIFKFLELQRGDVFVDIGHGIGNSVLQAAFTIGCESRGIELVKNRHSVASKFQESLERQLGKLCKDRALNVGNVCMRHGRLEVQAHRDFISRPDAPGTGCVKALANNFNRVFADRCVKGQHRYFLDNYVSALFANMKPGSRLVTLYPLLDLPPPLSQAKEVRNQHKLKCNEDASFYEVEEFYLGKANECVSWSANGGNTKGMTVYCYKRLEQTSEKAVFMCLNHNCDIARSGAPVPATKAIERPTENGTELCFVINHCKCGVSAKSLRPRGTGKSYSK